MTFTVQLWLFILGFILLALIVGILVWLFAGSSTKKAGMFPFPKQHISGSILWSARRGRAELVSSGLLYPKGWDQAGFFPQTWGRGAPVEDWLLTAALLFLTRSPNMTRQLDWSDVVILKQKSDDGASIYQCHVQSILTWPNWKFARWAGGPNSQHFSDQSGCSTVRNYSLLKVRREHIGNPSCEQSWV